MKIKIAPHLLNKLVTNVSWRQKIQIGRIDSRYYIFYPRGGKNDIRGYYLSTSCEWRENAFSGYFITEEGVNRAIANAGPPPIDKVAG